MTTRARPSDTVAFLAQTYTVPGGNGLPPLELSPLTPMEYVKSAIAARFPESVDAEIPGAANGMTAGTPVREAGFWNDIFHPVDALGEALQNFAVAGAILALALLLIAFGVWQLTKE